MKTYKPRNYGILIKNFGLRGQSYLCVSTLVFFDLQNADTLCGEQELWATVPGQLGDGQLMDQGFPKPHGEWLVTGSCFAPRGETRPACEVTVRVGDREKRLSVFGDRYWRKGGRISDPVPFEQMPVDWQHAFGGREIEENPLGRGLVPVDTADGRQRVPLPNVEGTGHLVGSPGDRPQPAGMAPLDLQWPQRMNKCGTYDKQWLETRWPWFPDDFDPEFFNCAPADQFIDGFFEGGEAIEIQNMHPDVRRIRSRLPGQRPRCFVTRKTHLQADAPSECVEVKQRVDTVWLFPTILRGLAFYRGTLAVLDDEFADIERIYVAAESAAEPPRPPEHYLEAQKKLWHRAVEMDTAPLEKANANISNMLKKMRQLPKRIREAKLKAAGDAPRMQRTPGEILDGARNTIAEGKANIDRQEAMARGLKEKFGGQAAIDLSMFDRMRGSLTRLEGTIASISAKTAAAQSAGDQLKTRIGAVLKERLSPEQRAQLNIDPDNLLPPKSINPWHDHGFPLVIRWRKNLERDAAAQKRLHDIGLARHTIKRAWLGVIVEPVTEPAARWGLPPADVALPAGLVMPRFDKATLTSVRVRPGDWAASDTDALVPASTAPPLFLPAVDDGAPVIVVGDELAAWLVEQEIGDCCAVLAMADAGAQPDRTAADAVAEAPAVVVVLPDTGDGDAADWQQWQQALPNARAALLPAAATLFDVHRSAGIRNWLMAFLPDDVRAANTIEMTFPGKGTPPASDLGPPLAIPAMDVKRMVKAVNDAVKAAQQPVIDKMNALKATATATARDAIVKAGKDPDAVLNQVPEKKGFADAGKSIADAVLARRDILAKQGLLSAADGDTMSAAAAQAVRLGQAAQQRHQAGLLQLAAAREKIAKIKAGELPDDLRQTFADAGVDPEQLKKVSREEVVARHERGMSLAGANLSGVDLSGLDLSGIDLSRARCRRTVFAGCRLRGVKMDQTLAQSADFSGADLSAAHIDSSILNKSIFKGATLSGARVVQSMLKGADFSKTACAGARFFMSVLKKANMAGADFTGTDCDMSVFSEADASGSAFTGARIHKCLFKRTILHDADFSNVAFPSSMLHGAAGDNVRFVGADLTRGRIAGGTVLTKADFSGVTMKQGAFRDSAISGANFDGADIDGSIIENCDLTQANLEGVSAKKTRLTRSNLESANLARINLFMGSLKKARLVNTDLSGANLFAVDLFKAVMGNTRLDDANLKRTLLHKRTEFVK